MADQPSNVNDSNASLVTALESIKGLLEQSEVKLSAARQSIQEAAPPAAPPADEEIPVLDDIVVPDNINRGGDDGQQIDREALLALLEDMQHKLEKSMRDNLMQAVVRAEMEIKKQLKAYMDQLRMIINKEN